ncbi:MAG: AbrB/MazE/SpoVT family DNA-binding domain-containing protein [Pirellulaceae bacterium]
MSKVTSKLQVTIPKAVAERFGIKPGDDIEWVEAGDTIRVELAGRPGLSKASAEERLKWFDQATIRQQERETNRSKIVADQDRGWTREELYKRGSAG